MRWHNDYGDFVPPAEAGETFQLDLSMQLGLGAGAYSVHIAMTTSDWGTLLLNRPQVLQFAVAQRPGGRGFVDLSPQISVRRP
jgi:hypothetical protein